MILKPRFINSWKVFTYISVQDGDEDHVNSCLTGFDMDPSVQFLGIDWERVSGRCFSLSMHANILESILLDDSKVEIDNLVLINKMLRDLAAIEADVLSHSEAVLRGRLSKSQRQLILDQQVKYASISSSLNHQVSNYQPSWKPERIDITLFFIGTGIQKPQLSGH